MTFITDANNLVAGDTNNSFDTFVFDRTADTLSLVSRNMSGGAAGNGGYYLNVAGVGGKHDDSCLRKLIADRDDRVESAHLGHLQIH